MTTAMPNPREKLSTAEAWQTIRSDPEIQFAPVELPETPQQPGWLQRILEFISDMLSPLANLISGNWSSIWPVLATIAGLLVLSAIYHLMAPTLLRPANESDTANEDVEWSPDRNEAVALLEDADRLAAQGRYNEAAHLLLVRSVSQISALRPELVEPSSTAREIAMLPALPENARIAFANIAATVEQSLFALRRLSAPEWQAARDAYAEFALSAERKLAA